jgi:hypothetical protein
MSMHGYRGRVFATALAIAATLAACHRQTPTSPETPSPSGPVTLSRVEISGPGTVFLGQTAQFTAIAHQTDGTTRNVTTEAAWSSSNTSLLSLAAPGQFTGRSKGQTSVRVALAGRNATMGEVIIVPEGTFRLIGAVRDAGALVEADVRIEDEALGRTDLRTSEGRYVVFGVRGDTRVTVTKSGYEVAVQKQMLAGHQAIDFELALARPRSDVTGRYTLTITQGPECRLTADFAARSFAAVVSQAGSDVTVTLEGPQFVSTGGRLLNRFDGRLEADRAIFRLGGMFDFYYYYFTYPNVMELLTPTTYYSFDGTATAALGVGMLSGPLSGTIGTYLGPPYRIATACRSANHRFVLTRSTT